MGRHASRDPQPLHQIGVINQDFIDTITPFLPEPGEITPEQLEGIVEDVIEQIEIPEGMTQAQVLNITLW